MISIEKALIQTRKALVELERLNLGDTRALLADAIKLLEHPAIRCVCIDDETYQQARQEPENKIRAGVED